MGRFKAKAERVCTVCGKGFMPNSNSQKTCSAQCSKVARAQYFSHYNSERYYVKAGSLVKRCRICGRKFRERQRAMWGEYFSHSFCKLCRKVIDGGGDWHDRASRRFGA